MVDWKDYSKYKVNWRSIFGGIDAIDKKEDLPPPYPFHEVKLIKAIEKKSKWKIAIVICISIMIAILIYRLIYDQKGEPPTVSARKMTSDFPRPPSLPPTKQPPAKDLINHPKPGDGLGGGGSSGGGFGGGSSGGGFGGSSSSGGGSSGITGGSGSSSTVGGTISGTTIRKTRSNSKRVTIKTNNSPKTITLSPSNEGKANESIREPITLKMVNKTKAIPERVSKQPDVNCNQVHGEWGKATVLPGFPPNLPNTDYSKCQMFRSMKVPDKVDPKTISMSKQHTDPKVHVAIHHDDTLKASVFLSWPLLSYAIGEERKVFGGQIQYQVKVIKEVELNSSLLDSLKSCLCLSAMNELGLPINHKLPSNQHGFNLKNLTVGEQKLFSAFISHKCYKFHDFRNPISALFRPSFLSEPQIMKYGGNTSMKDHIKWIESVNNDMTLLREDPKSLDHISGSIKLMSMSTQVIPFIGEAPIPQLTFIDYLPFNAVIRAVKKYKIAINLCGLEDPTVVSIIPSLEAFYFMNKEIIHSSLHIEVSDKIKTFEIQEAPREIYKRGKNVIRLIGDHRIIFPKGKVKVVPELGFRGRKDGNDDLASVKLPGNKAILMPMGSGVIYAAQLGE